MAFDSWRNRTVVYEPSPATWEYFAPCSVVGPGSPGGGLAIQCSAVPTIGLPFRVSFPSPLGAGLLLLDRAPALWPTPVLAPPFLCRQSFLYPNPALVFPMTGNPGVWSVQLPNDPGLFGQAYCLQGFSVNPGGCLDATDGLVLVLQR